MANELNHLAQIELLESKLALYRDAFESMHHGVCMFDSDGRITLVNRRYSETLGLPSDSVRPGLTGSDVVQLCIEAGHHPGRTLEEIRSEIKTQLGSGSSSLGTVVRGDRSYAMRQSPSRTGGIVTTCEDITPQLEAEGALRENEARLKAVLDAVPDCVQIFDDAGRLIHINPRGLELLQAAVIENLTAPGYSIFDADYKRAFLDVHRRVMSGENALWTCDVTGLQGRRRHVEVHSVPFGMPDGGTVHLCIARDVEERERAHEALRRSEERLRLVHEATGLADFEATPGMITQISDAFIEQIGLPASTKTLSSEDWMNIIHPDDRERFSQEIMANVEQDGTLQGEFRIIRPDNGKVRWLYSRTSLKRDADGNPVSSIGAHLDITERKNAEEALREGEERFRLAAEAAGLGVWDFDATLDRREWSDRLREILGVSEDVEPGLAAAEACIHPTDRERFAAMVREASIAEAERFEGMFRIIRANDAAERWVAIKGWRTYRGDKHLSRIITTVRDVTDEKTAEDRVRWTASHDPLTRLANRSLFHEKLDQAIHAAAAKNGGVGLIVLDMDHFKQINDTLGHDAGDMLLKMFAERLRTTVRSQDTIARFGGDEFAIVMPGIHMEQGVVELSRSIQERLREPFVHEGRLLDCRVSMGASVFPKHGQTPEELLKNADVALYAAKAAGRGILSVFEPHMRDDARRRNSMVELASHAVDDDRVIPYYQPKLDLRTGSLVGFEALLRWRTPRGWIGSPGQLEAAFEDLEVAAAISDRMIDRVIVDMRVWLDQGIPFQNVAVNASAAEFRRDNFAERVLEQLRMAEVPTACFQLEVTETVFLGRGAEYVHRALALLNKNGVKIALDDFGTGYASLRHLKQFPVDIIKIDQSFVRNMEIDLGDEAIIRAVINLGRSLGITVVAEGIEREEQAAHLAALDCDVGQGFLYSRAVPANRVPRLVKRWPTRQASAGSYARANRRLFANCA